MLGFVFVLCSCVSQKPHFEKALESEVYTSVNILFYEGEITQGKNEVLFKLFNSNDNIGMLEINSEGGDVFASMELGNWIIANNLDVKIGALCASSCANYIFTAGNKKILQEHSLLLWHGSSFQEGISSLVNSGDEFANKWRSQEVEFFEKIGVEHRISICGLSQVPIGMTILHNLNIVNLKGYDYSLKDMRSFGIDNIVISGVNWLGTMNHSFKGVFRASYC